MTRRLLDEPTLPLWLKVYFAVCVVMGFGLAAALIAIVLKVTR